MHYATPSQGRPRRGGTLVAVVLATVLLAGCQGKPVLAERVVTGSESIEQLQAWATEEVDLVTGLLSLDTRWRMLLDPSLEWPADRAEIFDSSHLPRCTFNSGPDAAAVNVDLITEPLDADLDGLIAPARERWEAEGWTISEIGSSNYIRADRADGAFITLEAAEGSAGKFVSLNVTSWCSTSAAGAQ